MIASLQGTANAGEFLQELEKATAAMQEERASGRIAGGTVKGGLVEIADVNRLAVVGDLHGDARALAAILEGIGREFLQDPLNKLVFLGDYVDRGSDSVGVLQTVCRLKKVSPDSVILMRGNHEAPSEFPFSSHDLPFQLRERFGKDAKILYSKALSLFPLLPLAVIVKGALLMVHGGLPTEACVPQQIETAAENHVRSRVMEEILWNDPREIDAAPWWRPSPRGKGRYFGSEITKKWLVATETRVVVRGHEPCQGYSMAHDGTVITLFSTKEAYPSFAAAYIVMDGKDLGSIRDAHDLVPCARMLDL